MKWHQCTHGSSTAACVISASCAELYRHACAPVGHQGGSYFLSPAKAYSPSYPRQPDRRQGQHANRWGHDAVHRMRRPRSLKATHPAPRRHASSKAELVLPQHHRLPRQTATANAHRAELGGAAKENAHSARSSSRNKASGRTTSGSTQDTLPLPTRAANQVTPPGGGDAETHPHCQRRRRLISPQLCSSPTCPSQCQPSSS